MEKVAAGLFVFKAACRLLVGEEKGGEVFWQWEAPQGV